MSKHTYFLSFAWYDPEKDVFLEGLYGGEDKIAMARWAETEYDRMIMDFPGINIAITLWDMTTGKVIGGVKAR